ncbi:hypothetical protein [Dongshaea marina]|uniref:hypothetical protein n=1 Tax=Dongshaea marina TaxID=2047966 RepID=UPI000D3E2E49|nr:hypothetical protein [Dongshaea marina]
MLSFDLARNPELKAAFNRLHCYCEKEFGCTYTSIYHESQITKNKIYWNSNQDWGDYYVSNDYIKYCQLFEFGRNVMKESKEFIMPWNMTKPKNHKQMIIDGERSENNVSNGVSFTEFYRKYVTGLAFASYPWNRNFMKDLMEKDVMFMCLKNDIFRFLNKFDGLLHRKDITALDVEVLATIVGGSASVELNSTPLLFNS